MAKQTPSLTEGQLRSIVDRHLLPMFSGATLDPSSYPSSRNQDCSSFADPCSIRFKPELDWPYRLSMRRSQKFDFEDVLVVDRFINALSDILDAIGKPYYESLLNQIGDRVVCDVLENSSISAQTISKCLNVLESWSSQTYEGNRIAYAVGIDGNVDDSRTTGITFSSLSDEDFIKVLSNGIDTMTVVNGNEKVFFYGTCKAGAARPFAPIRVGPLAEWTSGKSAICLILNRNGELLAIENGQMKFAKRRGNWHHFTHEQCVTQIGRVGSRDLRQSVYETCLDVSFARTGACICLVKSSKIHRVKKYVDNNDVIKRMSSPRSKILAACVGRDFELLDRRLRLELVSMDGATVIGHDGTILAAGAIVEVPGGSKGGGRRAATEALSRLGAAIKVSADGGITAFSDSGPDKNPKICFEICT